MSFNLIASGDGSTSVMTAQHEFISSPQSSTPSNEHTWPSTGDDSSSLTSSSSTVTSAGGTNL